MVQSKKGEAERKIVGKKEFMQAVMKRVIVYPKERIKQSRHAENHLPWKHSIR